MSAVATIENRTEKSTGVSLPQSEFIGHGRSIDCPQLHQLLLGQRYAQYELRDGSTVRIMEDSEDQISVKVLSADSERSFGAT